MSPARASEAAAVPRDEQDLAFGPPAGKTMSPSCIDISQTDVGPPTPEQLPLLTWTVDGEPIPYVEPQACDSQDGWTWLEHGIVVSLCGQPCELMKSMVGVTVEGRYGCPDGM